MISLLPQIQLIFVSFFTTFFFSFVFNYLYHGFIKHFNIAIESLLTLLLFLVTTFLYFKLCLYFHYALFSFYQILFLLLGVFVFYQFYFPYFKRIVTKQEKKTNNFIEKSKKTLYNFIKRMGGIIHGRSRKKTKKDYANE